MNMHGVVSDIVSAVNPPISATVSKSTGYTVGADFSQIPTYSTITGMVQVQGFIEREAAPLLHHFNLNESAVIRKMYAYGNINANIRAISEGGDIVQFLWNGASTKWKVLRIFEMWSDWCAVAIVQVIT
jgi:hypothetical protein